MQHTSGGIFTFKRTAFLNLNVSHILSFSCRKNGKSRNGSSGHPGDTRPGQTRKKTKDLSVREREDHGCVVRNTIGRRARRICPKGGTVVKKNPELVCM